MKRKVKGKNSPRLPGFDYSSHRAYFITINIQDRKRYFGRIENGKMYLSDLGRILEKEWLLSEKLRTNIKLDNYQIMPDHFHAIVWISDREELELPNYPHLPQSPGFHFDLGKISQNLSSMIRFVKGKVKGTASMLGYSDFAWQRSFYDRIIRNQSELERIRVYIKNNPARWLQ
ncbi:MAG: transposase [Bacteroidota bacterium]